MKKNLFLISRFSIYLLVWTGLHACLPIRHSGTQTPITHDQWDGLVKKHVKADGFVDYQGFRQDSSALNQYLQLLSAHHPDPKTWSREQQMAYWINAYNAFTIKLILDHYPVASIKDIRKGVAFVNSVWDIKWIRIGAYTYDLNNIEHNILRPVFKDARIHAAINCASYSCPRLRNEAYTAEQLNQQLDDAMRQFLADPLRNKLGPTQVELSEIFNWFAGDFKRDAGSVWQYLNRYSDQQISKETPITYLKYNWALNDAKP